MYSTDLNPDSIELNSLSKNFFGEGSWYFYRGVKVFMGRGMSISSLILKYMPNRCLKGILRASF
jgi:hypothetical protein